MEATEYSKHYDDPANPQSGFAALMVCGEADAGCPVVKGSAMRVSMPYLDPKIYDGGAYEAAKYAERRDDMGRLTPSVMMQARQRIDIHGYADQGAADAPDAMPPNRLRRVLSRNHRITTGCVCKRLPESRRSGVRSVCLTFRQGGGARRLGRR